LKKQVEVTRSLGHIEVGPADIGALKKVGTMAVRMPGKAVIKVAANDEMGKLVAATILGQFDEVPEDFAES
jgi:hypothetical protein